MRKLVTIVGVLSVSLTVHAAEKRHTGNLLCEVRTQKGAEAVISKRVNVADLTSTSAKPFELGIVNGTSLQISLADYYSGKAILSLKVSEAQGQVQEVLATSENVIGFTAEQKDQYLSVLCREAVEE